MNILVLNVGSSTLKFQVISTSPAGMDGNGDTRLCRGHIERIGGDASITLETHDQPPARLTASLVDVAAALRYIREWIASEASQISADIHAIGHRVVHGGESFSQSALITDHVLQAIEDCSELAPLHNPNSVKGIRAAKEIFGGQMPHVAVFDTAFHSSIPEYAYLYALPYSLYERHRIRRYGFHGTSHRYVAGRYRKLVGVAPEDTNVVSLHLGNGCSAAAIRGGRVIDTSMGLTPLEGLVMGTRSGDLDPAILSVIARKEILALQEVDSLLNTRSGLLGLSGKTGDMRVLEQEMVQNGNGRARLAIDVFCHRARKYTGAFLACMGGADALIFTGGIGENSSEIRARLCSGMEWAGLTLDADLNVRLNGREGRISTDRSTLAAWVIPTDEELLIARDTARVVAGEPLVS